MLCMRTGAPHGLRWGVLSLTTLIAIVAITSDDADARRRRSSASSYSPPSASIVVDANTGAVLQSSNPDALRHPASLTKIMTLYLLFEQLEQGKLKLDSPLAVSDHAEDQSPTKLGLEEGQTIKVEEAIKGMVTRSANDAAVVVAEAIGGSETEFAKLMTRKANALGMSKTVYRNASGLPDDSQVTTARDQSILGRAIQERFPVYYKYFQTHSFTFRGQQIGNHNRLLGRVEGVDGIKTGFIRASGFNLVTSVHRNNRYLVAVVLGGSSAGSRDARMRSLLEQHMAEASAKRTAPMVAEIGSRPEGKPAPNPVVVAAAAPAEPAPKAQGKDSQRYTVASSTSTPVRLDPPSTAAIPAPRAAPGSTDPIRPVAVKTLNVKPGGIQTASVMPFPMPTFPRAAAEPPSEPEPAKTEPAPVRRVAPARAAAVTPPPVVETAPAVAAASPKAHAGWIIQVGAYPTEETAKQQLASVKSKAARLLAAADAFTEATHRGSTTYYRARFAGLNQDQAEAACKYLKRNDVDCLAVKN
ncbi:MAG: D-alanyl-D-alanine carboxypeptidase [Alphaproteobacteria bacterium]|nr:D-alanyl-D-alanine carboxypeptidase [Alphaproteobacteria bacterium]